MATELTVTDRTVNERNSLFYGATLQDHSEPPVPLALASINSITLTVRDKATGVKILDAVNVLNTAGGTMHATSGRFEYEFKPIQNRMANPSIEEGQTETHVVTIRVVHSGDNELNYILPIIVEQLKDV